MADWTHRTSVNTLGEKLVEPTQTVERKKIVGKTINYLNNTWDTLRMSTVPVFVSQRGEGRGEIEQKSSPKR